MRSNKFLFLGIVLLIWSFNSSFIADAPKGGTQIIAHRGAHQTFPFEAIDNDTCTASRIYPPTHAFLENTIDGMNAAFAAGADVVEVDVHLTPDKKFAVFHDWTLDCRTDGKGLTEETPMADLKALDIGYGYTADGGQSFPFRGKGVGLMPSLDEMFAAAPTGKLLINFKSNREEEGTALAAMLSANPEWRDKVFAIFGGAAPTRAAIDAVPGLKGYTAESNVACLMRYMATGWIGHVPDACRNTVVLVPSNYSWLLWGWPNRFMTRMQEAGSEVILSGPYGSEGVTTGIDTPEQVSDMPLPYPGLVWTNRIITTGPLIMKRRP
jgi:glycerophosphoryl diester phosphodiesterase